MTHDEQVLTRRGAVVAGAGVVAAAALAACTAAGDDTASAASTRAASADRSPDGTDGPATALAPTADIPVGGGLVVGDTVITQPSPGVFVGLSSTCTHAGCRVASVSGGTINCACHGSRFGLDGSVVRGPAVAPLAAKNVRVEGNSIVAG